MKVLPMKNLIDRPNVKAEPTGNQPQDKQELRQRLLKLIVQSEAQRRAPKKPA